MKNSIATIDKRHKAILEVLEQHKQLTTQDRNSWCFP